MIKGIHVDRYVVTVVKRLKWLSDKALKSNNVEVITKDLEEWMPIGKWGELNILMEKFSKTTCR